MDKQSFFLIFLIIILSAFAFWAFFGTYINKKNLSISNRPLQNENTVTISAPAIPTTKTPSISPLFTKNDLVDFNYPNSNIVSNEDNNIILKSKDKPDTITNWYKTKIFNMKMRIETFIKTKSNENIANKIVAKNLDKQIVVDITKGENEQETTIIVSRLNGLINY